MAVRVNVRDARTGRAAGPQGASRAALDRAFRKAGIRPRWINALQAAGWTDQMASIVRAEVGPWRPLQDGSQLANANPWTLAEAIARAMVNQFPALREG